MDFFQVLSWLGGVAYAQQGGGSGVFGNLPSEFEGGGKEGGLAPNCSSWSDCGIFELIGLGGDLITAVIWVSIVFVVGIIVYVGTIFVFNAVTSGDLQEKKTKAVAALLPALTGLAIVLGAWLIVDFAFRTISGGKTTLKDGIGDLLEDEFGDSRVIVKSEYSSGTEGTEEEPTLTPTVTVPPRCSSVIVKGDCRHGWIKGKTLKNETKECIDLLKKEKTIRESLAFCEPLRKIQISEEDEGQEKCRQIVMNEIGC